MPIDIPTGAHEIPPGCRFTVRGQAFELDLLAAIYHLQEVAESVRQAGGSHQDYLGHVAELVQGHGGPVLSLGEADWLNDFLSLEYARQKKTRRDALHDVLGLPSSTASTPAD